MYQHNKNAQFNTLSTQQQVSLDRHQEMISDALRWQAISHEPQAKQEAQVVTQLRTVFASILTLFVR
jgi:hypothetical protein